PVAVLRQRVLEVVVLEDAKLRAAHRLLEAVLRAPELLLDLAPLRHLQHGAGRAERPRLRAAAIEAGLGAQVQPCDLAARVHDTVLEVEAPAPRGAARSLERGLERGAIQRVHGGPDAGRRERARALGD